MNSYQKVGWLDHVEDVETGEVIQEGTPVKIVQLSVHEELQNIFRPVFVNRSFACQYGRGPIRAALNVQHDMRVARMKWGDSTVIIKIDVKKFFYSIDRRVLKRLLAKRFKKVKKQRPELYEDLLRFYRLLCMIIDSSPEGETGIPLGNVSSQDFANIVLNEVDQYCIRYLGAKLYTRYMDDIIIVAPNLEIAREWLTKIKVFLLERLHLETNSKTKIFPMRQGVNAYGFKIKTTHFELRTESKRKEKRRIRAMIEKLKAGKITKAAIVQAVNSWLGFARWASSYNLAKKIFAPYPFIKTEGAIPYRGYDSARFWNFNSSGGRLDIVGFRPVLEILNTDPLISDSDRNLGDKVEACNNAFDDSPAWEDITAQVAINRVYNFLNQSKTAEKWGVNVRFTIEKNEGYEGEVSISGFGGAYE